MSNCECELAGWCDRHKCHKTQHMVSLCKTRKAYFDMWESGHGPGQTVDGEKPRRSTKPETDMRIIGWVKLFAIDTDIGVGDTVERLIAKAGGRAIKTMLSKLGFNCKCTNRQEWLNKKYPYKQQPFR